MDGVTESPSTTGDHVDLDELLLRSARGDRAAFARLYDAIAPRAYGLSLRVLHDRADAEAAVREACLHLWRTAGEFDPARCSARSWTFTIVHRTAVDHFRHRPPAVGREGRDDRGPDLTGDEALGHLPIRSALLRLPPAQHRAIELAYFGARTCTEVAGALGVPEGTARTDIRDGLIRLREQGTHTAA